MSIETNFNKAVAVNRGGCFVSFYRRANSKRS
jgi:hypothetical protein